MKLKKLALALLVLALPACVPVLEANTGPSYSVSEVELLTREASERWVYFYGDPVQVELDGTTLDLQPPPPQPHVWAVPGALWVSGEPLFREVLPALRLPARTVLAFPGLEYHTKTKVDLEGVWLYDGVWHRLSGPLAAGDGIENEGVPEYPEIAGLTEAETKVILREALARNPVRPLVIYQLAEPVFPAYRLLPRPRRYRSTALALQYGVEKEIVLDSSPNPRLGWKLLAKGAMSAYKDPAPLGLLAQSERAFMAQIWPLAAGNRVPRPAPPALDFGRQSVAAFFWGLKRSGGYAIEVQSVNLRGDVLEVHLILHQPPPGAIVTQALTSPYVIISVAGKPRLARFYDQNGKLLTQAAAR